MFCLFFVGNITYSFYGSYCANNGKDALNTHDFFWYFKFYFLLVTWHINQCMPMMLIVIVALLTFSLAVDTHACTAAASRSSVMCRSSNMARTAGWLFQTFHARNHIEHSLGDVNWMLRKSRCLGTKPRRYSLPTDNNSTIFALIVF